MIQNTAPHHLHAILTRVRDSGKGQYAEGWVAVLGADWDSAEFSKRHAEVVNLLSLTVQQLQALPERSRGRFMRYVPAWWGAVIQPKVNWADNGRAAIQIVGLDLLDHLESAADIISGNLAGSEGAPVGADLSGISRQCQEWVELLLGLNDADLSDSLKGQLISQLRHVVWLIEHVDLFGEARVSGEASRVIGSLAQASTVVRNRDPETAGNWKRAFLSLIALCALFNTGAPVVRESIEVGSALVGEIATVVQDIQD
ncbi:hypothetical protein [Streptomyces sp. NBC_00342]|uniref:hypothetical protein n=1 Tax=unclassified Streptomyces TaxID=2593676 RepID=UPI002E2CA75C|nr:hypothetical protein [Streptomyces sp. NBC_00342]